MPVEEEEDDDNLAAYQELVNTYATKPLTPEEEERRVKAATSAQGWGALGNGLSALSNLFFVGGVAPSQKLPDLPDTNRDIQMFRDRVNKNRAAYLANYKALQDLRNKKQALENQAASLALREWALRQGDDRIAYNRDNLDYRGKNDEANRQSREKIAGDRNALGWANHEETVNWHNSTANDRNTKNNLAQQRIDQNGQPVTTSTIRTTDDGLGNTTTVTTESVRQRGASQQNASQDNTPPTRRTNQSTSGTDNDNTPPSRRKK
jgi:hypothetical protein